MTPSSLTNKHAVVNMARQEILTKEWVLHAIEHAFKANSLAEQDRTGDDGVEVLGYAFRCENANEIEVEAELFDDLGNIQSRMVCLESDDLLFRLRLLATEELLDAIQSQFCHGFEVKIAVGYEQRAERERRELVSLSIKSVQQE